MDRENRNYKVEIIDSSKELSVKERVKFKDVSDAISLDELTQEVEGGKVLIDFDFYVRLAIHNEASENKDYTVNIYVDKQGNKYSSGSESLLTQFLDIYDELLDAEVKDFEIAVYRKASKNYKGKDFLTCTLV